MTLYRLVDDTGLFIEDVVIDDLPLNTDGNPDTAHYIDVPCPGGFYRPKWDGKKWVEGGEKPEEPPPEPTTEERLSALESAMLDMIIGGSAI